MKTGMDNYIFWSEIGLGFEEPGGTPRPRIPRSTPRAQTQKETRLKLQVKTFILVSKNTKNKRAQRHLPVAEFA